MIDRLNYTTHAIADLIEWEEMLKRAQSPSALSVRWIRERLDQAVKFILPDRGELLDIKLQQHTMDLVRLPYPVTVLEAPWSSGRLIESGFLEQTPASRRIGLYIEATRGQVNRWFPSDSMEGRPDVLGAMVVSISYIDNIRRWQVMPGGLFVDYGQIVDRVDSAEMDPATRMLSDELVKAEIAPRRKAGNKFDVQLVALMPDLLLQMRESRRLSFEQFQAMIISDNRDETNMLIQFCNVVNCSNVSHEDLPAPVKLAKAREKAGKVPFYTYKVLTLTEERPAKGGTGTGTHASPRQHLRRGHMRRLEGGTRSIWIRPTMVNAGASSGVVSKDYAVTTAERQRRADEL